MYSTQHFIRLKLRSIFVVLFVNIDMELKFAPKCGALSDGIHLCIHN